MLSSLSLESCFAMSVSLCLSGLPLPSSSRAWAGSVSLLVSLVSWVFCHVCWVRGCLRFVFRPCWFRLVAVFVWRLFGRCSVSLSSPSRVSLLLIQRLCQAPSWSSSLRFRSLCSFCCVCLSSLLLPFRFGLVVLSYSFLVLLAPGAVFAEAAPVVTCSRQCQRSLPKRGSPIFRAWKNSGRCLDKQMVARGEGLLCASFFSLLCGWAPNVASDASTLERRILSGRGIADPKPSA